MHDPRKSSNTIYRDQNVKLPKSFTLDDIIKNIAPGMSNGVPINKNQYLNSFNDFDKALKSMGIVAQSEIDLLKRVLFTDGPLLSMDKFVRSFEEANAKRVQDAGKAIRYMFENPSLKSIDNALAHIADIYTLGAVKTINGVVIPADPWSPQHITDIQATLLIAIPTAKVLKNKITSPGVLQQPSAAFQKSFASQGISNALPKNGRFAIVMPKKFADQLSKGKGKLSGGAEAWITAADDLKGINTIEGAARRLALVDDAGNLRLQGNAVVEFEFKDISGIASPYNRSNPGFISGGKTGGGAREWLVPSDAQITNIKIRYLEK